MPLIDAGSGFTVTILVDTQPVGSVYVTGAVPANMPSTIPEKASMPAMPPEPPIVHVPPEGEPLNVVTEPTHTLAVPLMADGSGLTVTIAVTQQPGPKA
jgi:hypothetical protein